MADLPFGITYTQMMNVRRAFEEKKMPYELVETTDPGGGPALAFFFDRFVVSVFDFPGHGPSVIHAARRHSAAALMSKDPRAHKARCMLAAHFGIPMLPNEIVAYKKKYRLDMTEIPKRKRAWRP